MSYTKQPCGQNVESFYENVKIVYRKLSDI